MKNFFNYLLTILIIILFFVTISLLTISKVTTEDGTKIITDSINYDKLTSSFKENDFGKNYYEYTKYLGIEELQLDAILKDKKTEEYLSNIFQSIVDNYLTNKDINVTNYTEKYINDINNEFNLNLNVTDKKELIDYTNETLEQNITELSNDEKTLIASIIKFCQSQNIHQTLYITMVFLTIILFINTLKAKNFLEYIAIIFISVGISLFIFYNLITKMNNNFINLKNLLLTRNISLLSISIIIILLGSFILFIQYLISKKIINREKVPF